MVMLMLFRVYKQISPVSNSAGEVFCLISEKCTNSIRLVKKKKKLRVSPDIKKNIEKYFVCIIKY